jgi:hypothetical protein
MINIPRSWDEVRIDMFVELDSIDIEQFESISAIQLERLSILTDTSSDDDIWDDMDIRTMNKIVSDIKFLSTKPSTNLNKSLLNGDLILIDFNTLTFGAFIDLEFYLKKGENQNLHKITTVLFRKHKVDEWGNVRMEPYANINMNTRSNMIMEECLLSQVYGALSAYKEWREVFLTTYSTLFQPPIEDDYDKEDLSEEELFELEEIEKEEAKMAEFGWQRMLISLSDNDFTKIDDYLEMGVVFLFNMLSVKKALKL